MSKTTKKSHSAAQLSSALIISVKEARKLLGKEYETCSDEIVAGFILDLHQLAQELLRNK